MQLIPGLSKEEAGYILWNHTGFPAFWNIPEDGRTPEECLRTQVTRFRDLLSELKGCLL